MKLVVGLGNPGKEYQDTRHNAGFRWVERLAEQQRAALKFDAKFHGVVGRMAQACGELWLLLPQTYMNASGRAVGALVKFYKIAPEEILVVHDELDLPPGSARLKRGGGNGGHNGLKDIAAHLGTPDFWRLRLGIGHPGDKAQVADYVLHPPRKEEAELIDISMRESLDVWPLIAADQQQAAMLKLHSK